MNILIIIASYLLGAIPSGLLLSKMAGIDVRDEGSGNIGATNVGRILGKKLGVLTLLFDVIKGYTPMLVAQMLIPGSDEYKDLIIVLCGLAAVTGHMFPVCLRFKGGKGVATALGVFLFISPISILIAVFSFIAVVMLSGFVSVGSLTASALMPFFIWFFLGPGVATYTAAVLAVMIWLKHLENINRLLHGKEKSWKREERKA